MCNEVTTSLSSTLHYSVYIFRFLHKRHVCLPAYGQGRRLGNVYCGIFLCLRGDGVFRLWIVSLLWFLSCFVN